LCVRPVAGTCDARKTCFWFVRTEGAYISEATELHKLASAHMSEATLELHKLANANNVEGMKALITSGTSFSGVCGCVWGGG
jgi:hypothetical protein